MFDLDRSAARGLMSARKMVVFKHASRLGEAPAHKLFEMVSVKKKEGIEAPRAFTDYDLTLPATDSLPAGVEMIVYC